MARKKQIVKSVKKTQKQKQKVSVVVNVNSNNKKKNVASRQPKIIQASPQVIHIQAPTPSPIMKPTVNDPPQHVANSHFMQTMGQAPYRTNTIPVALPVALPLFNASDRFPVKSSPQTAPPPRRRARGTPRGVTLLDNALLNMSPLSSDFDEEGPKSDAGSGASRLSERQKSSFTFANPEVKQDLPQGRVSFSSAKQDPQASRRFSDVHLHPNIKPVVLTYDQWANPAQAVKGNDLISSAKKAHADASPIAKKLIEKVHGMGESSNPRTEKTFEQGVRRKSQRIKEAKEKGVSGTQSDGRNFRVATKT